MACSHPCPSRGETQYNSNNIHVKDFNPDLLVNIKKINNNIITLTPIASNLATDEFSTANHQDITKIKKLYEDMDQKMYILTSMNKNATQLTQLESDFENLYTLVTGGTSSYQPMSGGSMISEIPSQFVYICKRL